MDSGKSGSILSSSGGGDEEYDSRATDSISAFITRNHHATTTTLLPLPVSNTVPFPAHLTCSTTAIFDPFSDYFHPSVPLPSFDQNHRSSLNLTPAAIISKTAARPNDHMIPLLQAAPQLSPQVTTTCQTTIGQPQPSSSSANSPSTAAAARNRKKRSRASRRTPTTVLTTDTNNFRAMVQEFTGIPSPPFASSHPFIRSRLDLFAAPSSTRSNPIYDNPPDLPPYLLRPFPQKLQPPPNPLSFLDHGTNSTASGTSTDPLVDMQVQISHFLNLSSSSNPSTLKAGDVVPANHYQAKTSVLDELELTDGANGNSDVVNGVSIPRTASEQPIGETSLGGFQGAKVLENGSAIRREGMLESWICSSD